ncbi:hypothetical protein ATL41_1386 [Flavimobilis soli]|uniref:LSD1 subclass zinc finger protein n=1 Tax=Flavimobilis soli TaxID=442709 RepID=A0A2A9ECM2_9MICO|nr:hypothetical protein [Flavimobilis soli]PFG36654.1 hypothetical protein ATL41_1386 [Flavimobilis soli]
MSDPIQDPTTTGPAPEPAIAELMATRCTSCGSQLAYAPGTSYLRCTCMSQVEIADAGHVVEQAYEAWARENAGQSPVAASVLRTLRCDGCGAQMQSANLSDSCQFCAGHLVAVSAVEGTVAPSGVLPFALDSSAAQAAVVKWVQSRWLAPNALKDVNGTEALRGTYVPHWAFDADTTTDYTGQRGEEYWEGEGEERTREVRWYSARGTTKRRFDDVLVVGTTTLSEKQLDDLTPWDTASIVPFQPGYLAGYSTVSYDVDPAAGLEKAKQKMAGPIRKDVEKDIGGDEQRVHSLQTAYANVMFTLLLLPVWIMTYMYAGKQWQVMVNATTGEVIGKRPYSPVKVTLAILAALAVVITLIVLFLRN